jgi:hypothetical protein
MTISVQHQHDNLSTTISVLSHRTRFHEERPFPTPCFTPGKSSLGAFGNEFVLRIDFKKATRRLLLPIIIILLLFGMLNLLKDEYSFNSYTANAIQVVR